ncbi:DUF6930 domain-containing protein [Chlorogloea sp. CCALA 695]|uniref:DUF6930 domain-containing protein n=1 Tax=Chlorogloea sp. CCALA 695 TaxID=2107693 RepID=UPI000D074FE0|nr:hypothetical protein [Chlorogloea sp. CCALA 695]PSB32290.1 hypothetical protein C7B70_11040 [Chlorogloea sp. CCALA 695]
MTMSLNSATRRRLQQLNQISSVWEGDRRPFSPPSSVLEPNCQPNGECILWVDGSQGVVRAMDVVAQDTGPEAIVRTLLRAIEHPNSPGKPARPQKIVVRSREIQFFLRGALQELDIAIDYVPELPLIDELYRSFEDSIEAQTPDLPPQYAQALTQKAFEIWHSAPWELLEEHQIISIELNQWDIGTLYASVMGMLGMEYGVLFYRSEESLKQFRAKVLLEEESPGNLEEAFLQQDCLFLTFDSDDEEDDDDDDDDEIIDLADLPLDELHPSFGNIHPLEGLRSVLYEEEALAMYVALDSLNRFIKDERDRLSVDLSLLKHKYKISIPSSDAQAKPKPIAVTVATMPELTAELEEMTFDDSDSEEMSIVQSLRDDLIPEDSFLSLGVVSWEMVDFLRKGAIYHQEATPTQGGDGLPVILIQTSRPKAMTIITSIQEAGGITGIGFNPGADPLEEESYDLGVLKTEKGEMFLFGEFLDRDPVHIAARKKWDERCKKTQGYCGLIVARGLMGASRGKPHLKDMMALFVGQSLSPKDLGIGMLQLMPQFE